MSDDEENGEIFEFSDEDDDNFSDGTISDLVYSSDETDDESFGFVYFICNSNETFIIVIYVYI